VRLCCKRTRETRKCVCMCMFVNVTVMSCLYVTVMSYLYVNVIPICQFHICMSISMLMSMSYRKTWKCVCVCMCVTVTANVICHICMSLSYRDTRECVCVWGGKWPFAWLQQNNLVHSCCQIIRETCECVHVCFTRGQVAIRVALKKVCTLDAQ